jgi:uncharacterized protein YdiU (UPF0061 family)
VFTTRYVNELPGTYSKVMPTPLPAPYWVGWNAALSEQMQLPVKPDEQLLQVMSGRALFQGHEPIAQKYAGHQFGSWNPELGDGRGLLLGEWIDPEQNTWELHLKGAGKTPYSRFGDGRAVLRSSIREFLGSEAMHGLGIATTRALGLIGSSERVYRETAETGAALLRVTPSHVRFGHFEWFAFSNQPKELNALIQYVIKHHYPACANAKDPIVALFEAVALNTADMIAGWMAYGFVHGVMNTDNMSILGETFDYGPYAFLDITQMNAVFNHTDEGGRYAFDQQANVGLWNIQRLGQALGTLTDTSLLAEVMDLYFPRYEQSYYSLMSLRLGGSVDAPVNREDINEWLKILEEEKKDYHQPFRMLSALPLQEWPTLADDFINHERFKKWCTAMSMQVIQSDEDRQKQMKNTNPVTVARTHHLQSVIGAAESGDFDPFQSLFAALQFPFEEKENWAKWSEAPENIEHVNLSCSS